MTNPLPHMDALLEARSVTVLWNRFVARLRSFGFAHLLYRGHRILRSGNERMIVDEIALSELPFGVLAELEAEGLAQNLPMAGWMVRNIGAESWGWLDRNQHVISAAEARALALLRRRGLGSGIAISLADGVPRMRAVLLLIGPEGATQAEVDQLWQAHQQEIQVLAKLMHQRMSSLASDARAPLLTARQREVLELTGLGFSCPDIALRLKITQATVEKHLRLARSALAARSTVHAVLLAQDSHRIFLDPGELCRVRANTGAAREAQAWSYHSFRGGLAASDTGGTD